MYNERITRDRNRNIANLIDYIIKKRNLYFYWHERTLKLKSIRITYYSITPRNSYINLYKNIIVQITILKNYIIWNKIISKLGTMIYLVEIIYSNIR